MKDTSLYEEEILGISSFINNVIDIPEVQGVYIVAHYSTRLGMEAIYVATIFSGTNSNNDLYRAILESNKMFEDGRLSFTMQSINDFDRDNLDRRKILGMKLFASGDILYDRDGNISDEWEKVNRLVGPFSNIVSIDNIDRVRNCSCKVLYKVSV